MLRFPADFAPAALEVAPDHACIGPAKSESEREIDDHGGDHHHGNRAGPGRKQGGGRKLIGKMADGVMNAEKP